MDAKDKILWADVYAQLSEFFKEPSEEFADDVLSGRLLSFFREQLISSGFDYSLLNGLLLKGDVFPILKEEYRKLFFGPMPPYIMPVESVYKRWTDDPECSLPIAREKGYLMGDPAMDMIKRYQTHGIVIPEKYASTPDHIALELEYMAFLCRNASESEQKEFLNNHLDWIDDLANDIYKTAHSGFYSAAIQITTSHIKRALQKYGEYCKLKLLDVP